MKGLGLLVAVLVLAGCGGGPSRAEVLDELASTTIIPAYQQLHAATQDLAAASGRLCVNLTSESLSEARTGLAAARAQWKYTEAMWVGPVMERRSWAVIDWPVKPEEIESLIADPAAELEVDYLGRSIGADQRGLQAIEYVLGGDDVATLRALADPRRCAYLAGIADVIALESGLLPSDWSLDWEGDGPYLAVFTNPDSSGLDALINDALFLLERMSDEELGDALGVMGDPADLDAVVEGAEGLGVADLRWRLASLRSVLVGDSQEEGLAPLLGDDLSDRLRRDLDRATDLVNELDTPLRQALDSTPSDVAEARQAIKDVQVTVATEVVGRLGVTIGFSDADGDSG